MSNANAQLAQPDITFVTVGRAFDPHATAYGATHLGILRTLQVTLRTAAMLVRVDRLRIPLQMDGLQPGETLEVSGSDQTFADDVARWCELVGDELLETRTCDGLAIRLLRKQAQVSPSGRA